MGRDIDGCGIRTGFRGVSRDWKYEPLPYVCIGLWINSGHESSAGVAVPLSS